MSGTITVTGEEADDDAKQRYAKKKIVKYQNCDHLLTGQAK